MQNVEMERFGSLLTGKESKLRHIAGERASLVTPLYFPARKTANLSSMIGLSTKQRWGGKKTQEHKKPSFLLKKKSFLQKG